MRRVPDAGKRRRWAGRRRHTGAPAATALAPRLLPGDPHRSCGIRPAGQAPKAWMRPAAVVIVGTPAHVARCISACPCRCVRVHPTARGAAAAWRADVHASGRPACTFRCVNCRSHAQVHTRSHPRWSRPALQRCRFPVVPAIARQVRRVCHLRWSGGQRVVTPGLPRAGVGRVWTRCSGVAALCAEAALVTAVRRCGDGTDGRGSRWPCNCRVGVGVVRVAAGPCRAQTHLPFGATRQSYGCCAGVAPACITSVGVSDVSRETRCGWWCAASGPQLSGVRRCVGRAGGAGRRVCFT